MFQCPSTFVLVVVVVGPEDETHDLLHTSQLLYFPVLISKYLAIYFSYEFFRRALKCSGITLSISLD
jgi:hypothetical protein